MIGPKVKPWIEMSHTPDIPAFSINKRYLMLELKKSLNKTVPAEIQKALSLTF